MRIDPEALAVIREMVEASGDGPQYEHALRCARAAAALWEHPDAAEMVRYLCSADGCGRSLGRIVLTPGGAVMVPLLAEAGSNSQIDPTLADMIEEPDLTGFDTAGPFVCRNHPVRVLAYRATLRIDLETARTGAPPIRVGFYYGTPPMTAHRPRAFDNPRMRGAEDGVEVTTNLVAQLHVVL